MDKVIETVGVLVFKDNFSKVLLVKENKKSSHITGVYGLPSGRLYQDQDKAECAVQELNEETGLTTTISDIVALPFHYEAALERKDGPTRVFGLSTFYVKSYSGEISPREKTTPKWVAVEDLDSLNLLPNVKLAIQDCLDFLESKPKLSTFNP